MDRLQPGSKTGGKPNPLLVDLLSKERVGTAFRHPGAAKHLEGVEDMAPAVPLAAAGAA